MSIDDTGLRRLLIAEKRVGIVAEAVILEIGVGWHDGACSSRCRFEPREFAVPGHIEADGFGDSERYLPFGIERIGFLEDATVQLHRGYVAVSVGGRRK